MSSYSELDPIISRWVQALGVKKLFTEWAGNPARYFYTPGDPPFEVFQVSIGVPENGFTTVLARAVDTNDDEEGQLEKTWTGPTSELDDMMTLAIETIDGWKKRVRKKADPPSPW